MKFIDWFAGVGGFRRGLELSGHECVGFCEFDKYAVMSYTSMHLITDEQRAYLETLPLKERQKEILKEKYRNGEWYADDIRTVYAGSIPKADCWCFGSPCQDFSICGERRGLDGDRSSLIREIFRLLGETREQDRPEWLIYENVKGMLSSNRGFDFLAILLEMDELGYDIEWQLVNSKYFGVPQSRERVFTIGHHRRFSERKILPVGEFRKENEPDHRQEVLCSGAVTRPSRDVHGIYIIDRQTDRQTECLDHHENLRFPYIIQIGNFAESKRNNPNQYRVYDPRGLSPCLTNMSQGGGRVPWIIC